MLMGYLRKCGCNYDAKFTTSSRLRRKMRLYVINAVPALTAYWFFSKN